MRTAIVPGLEDLDPLAFTHRAHRMGGALGVDLCLQRDDLLPVPFAGNKWIKLAGIVESAEGGAVYVTNGGIHSNHCKATALWAAHHGHRCHLVLHGERGGDRELSLDILRRAGATFDIVPPTEIAETIAAAVDRAHADGREAVVIPGGGHSPEGILAYSEYARPVLREVVPDVVVHASGTGGTQAGILHATDQLSLTKTRVIGISVARPAERGRRVVVDALRGVGAVGAGVDFRDEHMGMGYGIPTPEAVESVRWAAQYGLMLDTTYTGKAFAGLQEMIRTGEIERGSTVLFWHTGGGYLAALGGPTAAHEGEPRGAIA
ncbi:MAG: pyridoxal-phosphate dependent enzyme [Brachybacterium sp.]|uniref:1-aminocyclopropane-1-carboxylate deaminase/D-cysteine desulfhydrase n=1 Tax=Brachybacterium sp. TaxID=1891286 RepID=UPI002647D6EE|nr:pyridoxal-phosphate dependent enzyme [Brachybacterium sp.]MDN5686081.1 pyridoxal-phosphate dependent enzyme [Brachybacterium sp.]